MKIAGITFFGLVLGILGCGGAKTDATISGTDQASLQSSPAGAATLAFMDIETVRPDDAFLVPSGANVSAEAAAVTVGCRSAQTTTTSTTRTTVITFTNCVASNGWLLNGTISYAAPLLQPGHFTVVHNLNTQDSTGTKGWAYTGTKLVTIDWTARTATMTVSAPMTAAYHDSQNTANNRTYTYEPNLSASWTLAGQFMLSGSYTFTKDGSTAVSAVISQPLVWTAGCCAPTQGTLSLTAGSSVATGVFGPNCGDLKINGTKMPTNCQ